MDKKLFFMMIGLALVVALAFFWSNALVVDSSPSDTAIGSASGNEGWCTDTDNGAYTRVYGESKDSSGKTHKDTCASGYSVNEGQCIDNTLKVFEDVHCDLLEKCEEGKCVKWPDRCTTLEGIEGQMHEYTRKGTVRFCMTDYIHCVASKQAFDKLSEEEAVAICRKEYDQCVDRTMFHCACEDEIQSDTDKCLDECPNILKFRDEWDSCSAECQAIEDCAVHACVHEKETEKLRAEAEKLGVSISADSLGSFSCDNLDEFVSNDISDAAIVSDSTAAMKEDSSQKSTSYSYRELFSNLFS